MILHYIHLSVQGKQRSYINLSQGFFRIPDIINSYHIKNREKGSITKLDLGSNNITEVDFGFLINLFPNLQTVALRGNQINQLKNTTSIQNNKLLKLDLCKNQLMLQENAFVQFHTLKRLYLCENDIHQMPQKVFRGLEHLKYLDLKKNKIQSLPFSWFVGLKNLEELDVSDNLIESWVPADFLWQAKLLILKLHGNQLKSLPPLPVREGWSANLLGNKIYCGCHLPSHEKVPVNKSTLLVNCSDQKEISLQYNDSHRKFVTFLHFVQQHTPICEKPSMKFVTRRVNGGIVMKCTGFGVPVPNEIRINTTSGFIIKYVAPKIRPVLTLSGLKEEKSAKCTVRSLTGSISTKTSLESVSGSLADHGSKNSFVDLIGLCVFTILSLAINIAVTSVVFRKITVDRPDAMDEERND